MRYSPSTVFPYWQNKNVRTFYLLSFCIRSYVISAVWLYFFLQFIDYRTLGWVDGIGFALTWLVDIPTGALADRFGRKALVVIGCLAGAIGGVLFGFTDGLGTLFVANVIYLASFSFFSGALEALVYESLADERNQAESYAKVMATAQSFSIVLHIVAPIVGATLYGIDPRFPFFLGAFLMIAGFFVSLGFNETLRQASAEHARPKFLSLLRETSQAFQPRLRPFVLYALGVSGIYTAFSWGYLRPALGIRYEFSPTELSVVLAIAYIVSLFVVARFGALRSRLGDIAGMRWLGIVMGVTFCISALPLGALGATVIVLITICGQLLPMWISTVVNQYVEDRYRATLLSTIGFAEKFLYCIVAWLGGFVFQQGWGATLFFGLGLLSIMAAVVTARQIARLSSDFPSKMSHGTSGGNEGRLREPQ